MQHCHSHVTSLLPHAQTTRCCQPGLLQVWLADCRNAFSALTTDKQDREAAEARAESAKTVSQPDDLIDFQHLKSRKGMSQLELEDEVTSDLARATGLAEAAEADAKRLNRVLQLTGRLACDAAGAGPCTALEPCLTLPECLEHL